MVRHGCCQVKDRLKLFQKTRQEAMGLNYKRVDFDHTSEEKSKELFNSETDCLWERVQALSLRGFEQKVNGYLL